MSKTTKTPEQIKLAEQIKNSLNLPQTDFPMRAQLPQKEPGYIQNWVDKKLYHAILEKNKDSKVFSFCDGPPYANGHLHLGHALNKILKDITVKYKNLSGHKTQFIPTWDCHGLPIELNVYKKLKKEARNKSKSEIRAECKKEAQHWVEIQKKEFMRLGVIADWENPRLTTDKNYEAEEVNLLADILENNLLYQGYKPVYWCCKLQTALASSEVQYQDHTSSSIFVKFYLEPESLNQLKLSHKKTAFVIWTTTAWTLPANVGICLNPQFVYGLYEIIEGEHSDTHIIIAKDLKSSVEKNCHIQLKELRTFKACELELLFAKHPFIENRQSKVILGEHVTLEAGTGCVHTAPGHGLDDYHVGTKYQLPVLSPVDPAGRYTSDFPKYEGVKITEANSKIVADLKESKHLIFEKEITHSYPHGDRSKAPLIFRATPQWFINRTSPSYNLKKEALKLIDSKAIAFIPGWGKARLNAMTANAPDWCVSRQRTWGVPIPVLYCTECGHSLAKPEIMRKIAVKMKETNGMEAYFSTPVKEFSKGYQCEKCQSDSFKIGSDILDVWFDSGAYHRVNQVNQPSENFPADLYLEGSDQHRGWFQTSLFASLAANKKPPFKQLVTHGFVTDAHGKKMSKSLGNVQSPMKIVEKYGAEILRLWVAHEDYSQDLSFKEEGLKQLTDTYRKIRNSLRFLLGNIHDFNLEKDSLNYKDLSDLDKFALHKLNVLIKNTTVHYDNYQFHKVYHELNTFFVTLSSQYLDLLKDRLYTAKTTGPSRRSAQTVFYILLKNLSPLMSPILSFLSEEIHKNINTNDEVFSVFLLPFPKPNPQWENTKLFDSINQLLELKTKAYKDIEDLRAQKKIGSSLEIELEIYNLPKELAHYTESFLVEFFIVSKVVLKNTQDKALKINSLISSGDKCPRCWTYSLELIEHKPWGTNICKKCVDALL
ncbi:MAG: isoleucine--tRNA ligase [Bdellovibrionaceae bacterium]|nr:isoleucine--tRNA ligase [Pseudobdellovibrionaceae bacterium]